MGKIVAEGILFRGDSESGGFVYKVDRKDTLEYPDDECRDGYGDGASHGDCDGQTRRHWCYS